MIDQQTTLYVSEGCEPTVRVTPGTCIVQVAGGDVRIVGKPEHVRAWAQRIIDAVDEAVTAKNAEQAEAKWTPDQRETRHYKAALLTLGDKVVCPDGEYRTVSFFSHENDGRTYLRFYDGSHWWCPTEDSVPVVIRTAERSA